MPVILNQLIKDGVHLGVWRIEEEEDFFLQMLDLQEIERAELAAIKGHRRLEWLSSRLLLSRMQPTVGQRLPVWKDENGKPHFHPDTFGRLHFYLSFSHSRGMAAAAVAPFSIGVDIQQQVPKISAIAHKFMRDEEFACLHPDFYTEHLHVFWGAKEALYKAYGRRELDFRQHILVEPFAFEEAGGRFGGRVCKEDFDETFALNYLRLENYFLVWCVEK